MSLSFTNYDYKKDRKEGDIFGDDIKLKNTKNDNNDLHSNKLQINENDFKYICELYDVCSKYFNVFLNDIIKKQYRYINEYCFTQYDYISFMKLIFYVININLFDSSKYSEKELTKIKKCYQELIINFQEYKVEKKFNIKKEYIDELISRIITIQDYIYLCEILFDVSDKTLFSFISAPCMMTHYYRKYGENKKIENLDVIVPDENDEEYQKILLSVSDLVTKTNLYKEIDIITKQYLSFYKN